MEANQNIASDGPGQGFSEHAALSTGNMEGKKSRIKTFEFVMNRGHVGTCLRSRWVNVT